MTFNNLSPEDTAFINAALDYATAEFKRTGEAGPWMMAPAKTDSGLDVISVQGAPKSLITAGIDSVKNYAPIILVVEAWFTRQTIKDDSALAKALRDDPSSALLLEPRTDPNRKEGVMVQFFSKERHIMCSAEITRVSQGPPTLGEWMVMDNTEAKLHRTNFSGGDGRLASGIVR